MASVLRGSLAYRGSLQLIRAFGFNRANERPSQLVNVSGFLVKEKAHGKEEITKKGYRRSPFEAVAKDCALL